LLQIASEIEDDQLQTRKIKKLPTKFERVTARHRLRQQKSLPRIFKLDPDVVAYINAREEERERAEAETARTTASISVPEETSSPQLQAMPNLNGGQDWVQFELDEMFSDITGPNETPVDTDSSILRPPTEESQHTPPQALSPQLQMSPIYLSPSSSSPPSKRRRLFAPLDFSAAMPGSSTTPYHIPRAFSPIGPSLESMNGPQLSPPFDWDEYNRVYSTLAEDITL